MRINKIKKKLRDIIVSKFSLSNIRMFDGKEKNNISGVLLYNKKKVIKFNYNGWDGSLSYNIIVTDNNDIYNCTSFMNKKNIDCNDVIGILYDIEKDNIKQKTLNSKSKLIIYGDDRFYHAAPNMTNMPYLTSKIKIYKQ